MTSEREWLESSGIRPRKGLGQNFLLDPRIPRLIVERAGWEEGDPILEIGSGGGALTAALLEQGHPLRCVERDRELVALLERRFAGPIDAGTLEVWEGDALQLEETALAGIGDAPGRRPWVAGNLPYPITTPLLLWCYQRAPRLQGAVVMVQREYGDRLLAEVGTRTYGSITVWTRAHATPRSLLRVGRSSFWPRPGVESVVLELTFPSPPPFAGDRRHLQQILRAAFGQRRKMLQNTLASGLGIEKSAAVELLRAAGCDPGLRAENLSLEDYTRLTARWSDRAR